MCLIQNLNSNAIDTSHTAIELQVDMFHKSSSSAPSVADLMITDRCEITRIIATYVVGAVILALIMYSPAIVLISITKGNVNTSRDYIPRGSSLMWKYSCAIPSQNVTVHGDILRIAAKSRESSASNYESSKLFCSPSGTAELCALSRATFRSGVAKWVADVIFFATAIGTTVTAALFLEKVHASTVIAISATLFAASANIGVAAMSAQVAAVRAFTSSIACDAQRESYTASFGAIFAASCLELIMTIVYAGTYIVFHRRAQRV